MTPSIPYAVILQVFQDNEEIDYQYLPSFQAAFNYCEEEYVYTFEQGEAMQLLMLNWKYNNGRYLFVLTPVE